jgi:hypothetical protein
MPKPKSNKDASQPETPSSPEQQLLSIKPKRPQQESPTDVEKTTVQPVEQKLLSIKPKKIEEATPPSSVSSATSEGEVVKTPETQSESVPEKELKPASVASTTEEKEVALGEKNEFFSNALDQPSRPQKPAFQKPQLRKPQPPPYKNLETVTTTSGETFAVGEQVRVTTANYGEYVVAIKFIYEAADGSVWASYSHTNKEQRHPWRWGCCRADLLKKELQE